MINHIKVTKLQNYLINNLSKLEGNWVARNSSYENDLCSFIPDFQPFTTRYYDCIWGTENIHIEFKKGKSIWIDLVRYSEIILGITDEAKIDTYTLFFIPNTNYVQK